MSDTGDASPLNDEQPGQRIRQYEILAEIGRGGMGILYHARDHRLERDVALKRPLKKYALDPEQRRRFLREGRAASRIAHPSIVTVFDTFEDNGVPWLAMELVPGRSLRTLLAAGGRLSPRKVLHYGEQLVSALNAAHEKSVLHRDVNPRNILITPDERALLTDFGLARFLESAEPSSTASTLSDSITSEGAVVGTPQYMSPEQVLGKPLDTRSDLFSLGAVLYEMCTGQAAFARSQTGDLVDAIIHREPEPISRFSYEVPEDLERIIRKCMAKLPEERYQDAADLLADIRTVRNRLEFREYSSSHTVDAAKRRLRVPPSVAYAAAGAAVALSLAAWWMVSHRTGRAPIPQGRAIQVTTSPAWDGEPAVSPDGTRIAYASDEAGNLDIYVIDVHGGNPLRLSSDPATEQMPAWFPDGSAVAFERDLGAHSAIWKTGAFGGGATLLVSNASDPAISPDGREIAFARKGSSGAFRIWKAALDDPGEATMLTGDHDGRWYHRAPAWSPDGSTICYHTRENLWLVPARGGPARRLTFEADLDVNPEWSGDGRFIYFASDRDGSLAIWRTARTGRSLVKLTMGTGPESHPAVSRDGSRLAHSTQKSTHDLVIRNRKLGQEITMPGRRNDWMPAVAPDGRSMVFISDRWGGRFELWRQQLDDGRPEGEPVRLTDQTGDASYPAFSTDGRWIAYYRVDNQQRDIWVIPSAGGEPVLFAGSPAGEIQPAWSPDGSRIAFCSDDGGRKRIWIASIFNGKRTGDAVPLTPPDMEALAPAWSLDGGRMAFVGSSASGPDGWDAWIIPSDGSSPPRRVTRDSDGMHVHWDPATGDLLVSGSWNEEGRTVRRVKPAGGDAVSESPPVLLGIYDPFPYFSLSADGHLLVYSSERLSGDIWVLEASTGSSY